MTAAIAECFKKIVWFWEKLQVNGSVINSQADGRSDQRFLLTFRYFSWRKLLNVIRVEFQLRLGRQKVWGKPYEWEIDTTNICQLKCPLCHTGLGTIHRDKGTMHFDLFTKTIDQIKDYCVWLTLYSWGEPFLNRRIHEFVAYAHQRKIATIISTNLNKPLTQEMAENIIRSGLDVMIISIDGVTQEVYQQYRVGGRLDRVLANINLLVQKKRELGYTTPHLEWQFIVMRQNEHQMDEASQLAGQLGVDSLVFKKVDFPHGMSDPEEADRWLPRDHPDYQREAPFNKPFEEDGHRCWRLWRSAVVNWDGGFAPCCYLTDKSEDFGDASVNNIEEIWNNPKYATARGLFKEGYNPEQWVGCVSCSVYTGSRAARKRGELTLYPDQVNGTPIGSAPGNGLGPVPPVTSGAKIALLTESVDQQVKE